MASVIWTLAIWVWKDGLRRFLHGERDARGPRACLPLRRELRLNIAYWTAGEHR